MIESVYVFLIRNDVWIYILCGLGLLWYLSQLVRSQHTLKRAMFGLEKERGRRMLGRSLIFVLLFLLIIGAVSYVNLRIAPTLPADLLKPPTPTPNIFVTPLSSPTPAAGQPTPSLEIAPTVTLPAANLENVPLGSPEGSVRTPSPLSDPPLTPTGVPIACDPAVSISSPPSGANVSGTVTFFGTATADNFGYHTFEYSGPETGEAWTSLPSENAADQVFNNIIGSVNTLGWSPGLYSFRLSVFSAANDPIGQCQIQVSVVPDGS